jgi:hypothetical protein
MRSPRRKPDQQFPRLSAAFRRVRRFVVKHTPRLSYARLYPYCEEIREDRRESPRSFMHVGCRRREDVICTWGPDAERLPIPHLIGILIHEFAHLANPKGEMGNDLWATLNWGVVIEYRDWRKAKTLEWVSPALIKRLKI